MTQELAKELKDAGFPVKEFMYDEKEYVINITLSELIEACGEDFARLDKNYDTGGFTAMYVKAREDETTWWHEEEGKTPEEAVAKLYIALHEPKD